MRQDYMIFFKVRQAEKQGKAIRKEKGTMRFSYIWSNINERHTQSFYSSLTVNNNESRFFTFAKRSSKLAKYKYTHFIKLWECALLLWNPKREICTMMFYTHVMVLWCWLMLCFYGVYPCYGAYLCYGVSPRGSNCYLGNAKINIDFDSVGLP